MSDFFVRVFLIYHVVVLVLVRVPVCVWSCARALFCLYIRNLVFYDVSLFFCCRRLRDALTAGATMTSDLTDRFHGQNERLGLRSLWTSVQFYSLVRQLPPLCRCS